MYSYGYHLFKGCCSIIGGELRISMNLADDGDDGYKQYLYNYISLRKLY